MRENHFLAPELFAEYIGRTKLAGAYILPKILIGAILLKWGMIYWKILYTLAWGHKTTMLAQFYSR